MNRVGTEKKYHNSLCFHERKSYKVGTTFLADEDTISSDWLLNMMLISVDENIILHVHVSSPLLTRNPWWAGSIVPSPSYSVSYTLK